MTRKPAGPHGSTTRSGGRKGTVPAQPTIHQDKVDSEVAPTKGTEHALEKVSERASGKGASVQVPGEKHESPKKGPEQEAEKGHDSETEPSTGKAGDDKVTGKRPAKEAPTTSEQPVGLKRQKMACGRNGVVVGPRIPFQYFVTKGFGDTDEGTGSDPYETGSYDMALETAKIHQFNIIQYTSVLPPEAVEVPLQNAERTFMHGAVLETIMSVMHGTKGDRICAGIGRIHVRRKKDKFVIGGYAAEYKGHACAADATKALQDDLRGIVERRYSNEEHEGFDESYTVQEHEVKKSYGTVLAAICFTSYILPEIASSVI